MPTVHSDLESSRLVAEVYRPLDQSILLVDYSEAPDINDRKKKAGASQSQIFAAVDSYDVKTGKRIVKDGLFNNGEDSKVRMEFDNVVYNRHTGEFLDDRNWSIRLIVDQDNPHDGGGGLEPNTIATKNRSTLFINQKKGSQDHGASHDLFAIIKIRDAKKSRVLRLNGAGVYHRMLDNSGKDIATGAAKEESHLALNVSTEAGWVSDGLGLGQLAQIITFPDAALRNFWRNQDGQYYSELALNIDTWFHSGGRDTGPLAMDRRDSNWDFRICREMEPENQIRFPPPLGKCLALTGYHYYSRKTPLPFLRPLNKMGSNPVEDNPGHMKLDIERVLRPIVFLDINDIPIRIETPCGEPKIRKPEDEDEQEPGEFEEIPRDAKVVRPEDIGKDDEDLIRRIAEKQFENLKSLQRYMSMSWGSAPFPELPIIPDAPMGDAVEAIAYAVNGVICSINHLALLRLHTINPCKEELKDIEESSISSEEELVVDTTLTAGEDIKAWSVVSIKDNRLVEGLGDALEIEITEFGSIVFSTINSHSMPIGIAYRDVKNGEEDVKVLGIQGRVYWVRMIDNLNPSIGDFVYLSSIDSGKVTTNKPVVSNNCGEEIQQDEFYNIGVGTIVDVSKYETCKLVAISYGLFKLCGTCCGKEGEGEGDGGIII